MADQPAPQNPAGGSDGISFFCPSGHRILVPRTLAGKRGACSKCGVDVTIPLTSQPAAPPPVGQPPITHSIAPAGRPDAEPVGPQPESVGPQPQRDQTLEVSPAASAAEEYQPPTFPLPSCESGQENPTAMLVARLWVEREHGGIVELHLTGGSVILPEWFETNWSRGTHGVFASQAVDGSVTLTAVAWDTIAKIVVRQVQGLPDGMFE